MILNDFWTDVLDFFLDQNDLRLSTCLYLGLASALILTIAELYYLSSILKQDLRSLKSKYWLKFTCYKILIIVISLSFDFIAVGILGFCALSSGQILKTSKNTLIKILGYILNPIFYFLGSVGLVLTFFGIFGGEPLYYDLGGLLLFGGIFIVTRGRFKEEAMNFQGFDDYIRYIKNHGWNKLNKPIKVVIIFICLITPAFLFSYSYLTIMPLMKDIMLPMSDGVRLKTRIYFPNDWDGQPRPVILSRTPYDIGSRFANDGLMGYAHNYVLSQDYIMVGQDIRGTHGSEGEFYGFLTDYNDGNDTVNWIMEQDWCNGKVATVGGSALAINQICYHPSLDNPPNQGLRTASIVVGTSELYEYCFFIGGCLRQWLAECWLVPVSGNNDAIDVTLEHAEKDEYWDNVSLESNNRYENVDVRALHLGGWYDMFAQGTIDAFDLYNQGTEYAQDHQFLVMGPWNHSLSYVHEDITFPDYQGIGISYMSSLEGLLFNEYLGDNSSIGDWNDWPRVYYYVMGDPEGTNSGIEYNHWRNNSVWPVTHTPEAWYLHPDGTLSLSLPSGADKKSYLYDPRNPVITGGGTTFLTRYSGAIDQRRVEYTEPFGSTNRSDILKFTSKTLSSPVEIVGNITTELYISSNCTDTDFTAKLIDVYPDGKEIIVADGILKARYRDYADFEAQTLMDGSDSTIYELNIDMWSTAYRFIPGHQIRLSISSSNWNKFAVNPNTGEAVANIHPNDCTDLGVNFNIANNSVCCGIPGSMSRVWFPRTL
ncbi:MAG: CocE/NonD family hydrolase [Candidatus Lokiarchaeota archaeon]|nr:CocE/NonD family hydrolase [Candidatus Lokiarchaeota archaeon]